MEAASDYWKPFCYLMEDELPVMLVNAKQARNIPGHKTNVNDAMWLANLAVHELLSASFIPPQPLRKLRDLTRERTTFVRDRTKVYQRIEKFLESSRLKLSSVASSLTLVSAGYMLDALTDGERDATILAELSHRSIRRKIRQLIDALEGRFTEHHAFMMQLLLHQIDELSAVIDQITLTIDATMAPFHDACAALETIPGISRTSAQVILTEIGADLAVFLDAEHLASWAGVCREQNESAGRSKPSHTRRGNMYLKAAFGTAALASSRQKDTFLAAKFRRLYVCRAGS